METWDEIRQALDLALRGGAVAGVGLIGYAVTLLLPVAKAWIKERLVACATARLGVLIDGAAARIVDPLNSSSSVASEAERIATNATLAMKNSASTVAGVREAIDKKVSALRIEKAPAQ